jgi:hypothetical protein
VEGKHTSLFLTLRNAPDKIVACWQVRKYIDYKAVEKEGLTQGRVEFSIPGKPGDYVFRYLKGDYTELALSPPVSVRSALTVLLDEVKALTVNGDTESVVELLETVMLRIKGNDDALHRQALESWRQQQARKTKPPPDESNEKDAITAATAPAAINENLDNITSPVAASTADRAKVAHNSEVGAKKSPRRDLVPRKRGVTTVRVRGTGCYAHGKQGEGDSRCVWVDGKAVVGGEAANKDNHKALSAKKSAGLWLLVLRLRNLETLFSCCYDT